MRCSVVKRDIIESLMFHQFFKSDIITASTSISQRQERLTVHRTEFGFERNTLRLLRHNNKNALHTKFQSTYQIQKDG